MRSRRSYFSGRADLVSGAGDGRRPGRDRRLSPSLPPVGRRWRSRPATRSASACRRCCSGAVERLDCAAIGWSLSRLGLAALAAGGRWRRRCDRWSAAGRRRSSRPPGRWSWPPFSRRRVVASDGRARSLRTVGRNPVVMPLVSCTTRSAEETTIPTRSRSPRPGSSGSCAGCTGAGCAGSACGDLLPRPTGAGRPAGRAHLRRRLRRLRDDALPVLRRYGFGATVYVVAGKLGGRNDWDPTARARRSDRGQVRDGGRRGCRDRLARAGSRAADRRRRNAAATGTGAEQGDPGGGHSAPVRGFATRTASSPRGRGGRRGRLRHAVPPGRPRGRTGTRCPARTSGNATTVRACMPNGCATGYRAVARLVTGSAR